MGEWIHIFFVIFAGVQRKFIGNLIILQGLNWLVKPVWIFWIDRLTQVNLGDEWYGRYFVIFSFALLFNILLDFGLNNFVSAAVGRTGDPGVAKPILRIRLWLGVIFILLILALGFWQHFDPIILLLVVANQVLAGFTLFFRAILQGRHWFRTDSLVSVTDRLVAIIICAGFLYAGNYTGRQGLIYYLSAQTAGYAIACFVAVWLSGRGTHPHTEQIQPGVKNILQQTSWFAVLAFAMSVFTRIDAWMIHYLSPDGDAEAGLYAQSFRLLDAALIFSTLISSMLLPVFSRSIEEKKPADALIWLNIRIILFAAIPFALSAWFFGSDILQILYGKSYQHPGEKVHAAAIFGPLLTCFVPMALVHIFGTWLTAAHRVKYLSFLAFAAMSVNILLNLIFIPEYGAVGAAWSCLITQSFFALGCIGKSVWLKATQWSWFYTGVIFLWLTASLFIFWGVPQLYNGLLGWIAACSIFVVATVMLGIFWPEMKKVLKIA